MKNNKIISFIIILLMIFVTLMCFSNTAFAIDAASNPEAFKPKDIGSETELQKRAGTTLGVINVCGAVISVITLMVIGIKYMLGSVEEKAEYKKSMGLYILGAALLFSITTIANILYKIGSNLFN